MTQCSFAWQSARALATFALCLAPGVACTRKAEPAAGASVNSPGLDAGDVPSAPMATGGSGPSRVYRVSKPVPVLLVSMPDKLVAGVGNLFVRSILKEDMDRRAIFRVPLDGSATVAKYVVWPAYDVTGPAVGPEGFVYGKSYRDSAVDELWFHPFPGGTDRRLGRAGGPPEAIALVNGMVYASVSGNVLRTDVRGSGIHEIVPGAAGQTDFLVADDRGIAWQRGREIVVADLDGRGVKVLAREVEQVRGLSMTSTHVFYVDAGDGVHATGSAWMVPRLGGKPERLAGTLVRPFGIVGNDRYAVVITNRERDGEVILIDLATHAQTFIARERRDPAAVELVGDRVYWADVDGDVVMTASVSVAEGP